MTPNQLRILKRGAQCKRTPQFSWRWHSFSGVGPKIPLRNADTSALMRASLVEEKGGWMHLTDLGDVYLERSRAAPGKSKSSQTSTLCRCGHAKRQHNGENQRCDYFDYSCNCMHYQRKEQHA